MSISSIRLSKNCSRALSFAMAENTDSYIDIALLEHLWSWQRVPGPLCAKDRKKKMGLMSVKHVTLLSKK